MQYECVRYHVWVWGRERCRAELCTNRRSMKFQYCAEDWSEPACAAPLLDDQNLNSLGCELWTDICIDQVQTFNEVLPWILCPKTLTSAHQPPSLDLRPPAQYMFPDKDVHHGAECASPADQ